MISTDQEHWIGLAITHKTNLHKQVQQEDNIFHAEFINYVHNNYTFMLLLTSLISGRLKLVRAKLTPKILLANGTYFPGFQE